MADATNIPPQERMQFIEPFAVQDAVVTGIADIEEIAPGMYRVALYTEGKCMLDGSREHMISVKLVLSSASLEAIGRGLVMMGKREPVRLRLPAMH